MSEKELYLQKKQAQLKEWQTQVNKLKIKFSVANKYEQLELNNQIKALEGKIEEGEAKIADILEVSIVAWESIRKVWNLHGVPENLPFEPQQSSSKNRLFKNRLRTELCPVVESGS